MEVEPIQLRTAPINAISCTDLLEVLPYGLWEAYVRGYASKIWLYMLQ